MIRRADYWPIAPCNFYTQEHPVQICQTNTMRMSNDSDFPVVVVLFVGERNFGGLQTIVTIDPYKERVLKNLPLGIYWFNVYYGQGGEVLKTKILKTQRLQQQGTHYFYIKNDQLIVR